MTRAEVTSLLQLPPLSLDLYDASALAGLLVVPQGGAIQALSSLSLSPPPVEHVTEPGQGNASTFCKQMAKGWGFLPTYIRFDPTWHDGDNSIHYRLVPSAEEISKAPRLIMQGEKMGYQTWGETEQGGVQKQFAAFEYLYSGLEENGQKQLCTRNLAKGIAVGISYEDGHHRFGDLYFSTLEHKGAETSVLSAFAQASVTATNFAMRLLDVGVPRADCIVPVFANTGLTFLVGATIVLDRTFPTCVPISKPLNLLDAVDRQIASAYLVKASVHCRNLYSKLRDTRSETSIKPLTLELGNLYYVKTLTPEVYCRGLGLFASHTAVHTDIDIGVHHMIDALNRVYASDARQFAEYPLSIRTPDAASNDCYQIIYRDLTKLGFRIGIPDRETNENVYKLYVDALTCAVRRIHCAGVIHVDLYSSNIMWRCASGEVEIKIIDWDAAHCLDEGEFVAGMKPVLDDYIGEGLVQFGVDHDLLYLSVLSLDFNESNKELWEKLASDKKSEVDSAFRELLNTVIFTNRS